MARLRAVKPGEVPKRKITSVLDAAERGSRLDELIQMRIRIAKALDDPNTLARDLASLSRRQIEIGKEIDVLKRQEAEEGAGAENVADEPFNAEAI